jgi:hypothetical protein
MLGWSQELKGSTAMKAFLAPVLVAIFLSACGGGGGNPGTCSGSAQVCADAGGGSGGTVDTGGTGSTDGTGGTTDGNSVAQVFSRSGFGSASFQLPADVTRLRIRGSFDGATQVFIVRIGGTEVVHTLIGTAENPSVFNSDLTVRGGSTLEMVDADGISWSVQAL